MHTPTKCSTVGELEINIGPCGMIILAPHDLHKCIKKLNILKMTQLKIGADYILGHVRVSVSVKGHGRVVDSTGREMRGEGGGATTKLIIKSHLILQHEPETPRVQTPSNSPQSPCMPRGDTLTVNRINNRRHKRIFLYTLKCLHLR